MTRERRIDVGCLLGYVLGVVARWRFICVLHDPREYIWSDMKLYVELGTRFAASDHAATTRDVIFPPGEAKVFAWLIAADPTLALAVRYQLLITALLPLAILALGWVAFGKSTGRAALLASSFYFPFIDYGGYFLTEIPMALLMTLTAALFLWAIRRRSPLGIALGALGAGAVCSAAMAFKFVALPAMLCLVAVFVAFHRHDGADLKGCRASARHGRDAVDSPALGGRRLSRKLRILAAAALIAGTLPLSAAMSYRCTTGNGGRFCLVSNKGPADFLMGHYGRFELLRWNDGDHWQESGSPSAHQRGYRNTTEVPFAISDGERNSAQAWGWIRANPGPALVLSVEHVYDLFFGALPWPTVTDPQWWHLSEAFHFLFIVLVLMPVLFLCFDILRRDGLAKLLASRELLVLSPVFGVMAAVFIATGEPRYRVPFDGFLLVLAVEFQRRWRKKPAEDRQSHITDDTRVHGRL